MPLEAIQNSDHTIIKAKVEQVRKCKSNSTQRFSSVAHDVRIDRRSSHLQQGLPGRQDTGATITRSIRSHLPRVVMATIGTGINVEPAINALLSAYRHFGGDCITSYHLLTDDPDAVDSLLNPKRTTTRERSHRDIHHFHDLLIGLEAEIKRADYFIFVDPQVEFSAAVTLDDLSGDLFGVEHPEYPRDHLGHCQPRTKSGRVQSVEKQICEYPYSRNTKSRAYVPPTIGKFVYKGKKKHPDGHNQVHWVTSSWYLHSGLWGGKSKFVLELLDKLAKDVVADLTSGAVADVAEHYLNHYMWLCSNRSDMNIRIHGQSFLYPAVGTPGEWITRRQTPKISYKSGMLCGGHNC